MGKFIESTLKCMLYFFLAWLAGTVIIGVLNIIIENVISAGTARRFIQVILETAAMCVLLYIAMHRRGHKGDISTFAGKRSVKEIIIPSIIAVFVLQLIPLFTEMQAILSLPPEHYLSAAGQSNKEIFISLLPRFIPQSILYTAIMILGYHIGYKKYKKRNQ